MHIKKGRHKKVIEHNITNENAKSGYVYNDNICFKNKVYEYKDGSHCTVLYSECKDKPIYIKIS